MKISLFCTPGAATDKLRKDINAPEFGERLIGRLHTEAIPGIATMSPAERPLTHVHLLDATTDGKLSFYAELSGVTPKQDRNLGMAATIPSSCSPGTSTEPGASPTTPTEPRARLEVRADQRRTPSPRGLFSFYIDQRLFLS